MAPSRRCSQTSSSSWPAVPPSSQPPSDAAANDIGQLVPVPDVVEKLVEIDEKIRAAAPGARVVVAAPPPISARLDTEGLVGKLGEALLAAPQLAGRVVDFSADWVGSQHVEDDGMHPSKEGHRQIAMLLWPTLEELANSAVRECEEAKLAARLKTEL
jgi:lysophospholipase L1-like esterase